MSSIREKLAIEFSKVFGGEFSDEKLENLFQYIRENFSVATPENVRSSSSTFLQVPGRQITPFSSGEPEEDRRRSLLRVTDIPLFRLDDDVSMMIEPVEMREIEVGPVEERPVEVRPVEVGPVEERPVEERPVETRNCEFCGSKSLEFVTLSNKRVCKTCENVYKNFGKYQNCKCQRRLVCCIMKGKRLRKFLKGTPVNELQFSNCDAFHNRFPDD